MSALTQNTSTASLQKGKTSPMSVLNMTLNNLVMRLHECWSFKECRVPLYCYIGVIATDRVLSMGQIELNCVLMLNWIVWNRTVYRLIGQVGRVFANGPRNLGSVPGRIIPKTFKMVLDTSLLNTQQCKVCIKGEVEQSRERSSALLYTSV